MTIELIRFSKPTVSFDQAYADIASNNVGIITCQAGQTYDLSFTDPKQTIAKLRPFRESQTKSIVARLEIDRDIFNKLKLQTVAFKMLQNQLRAVDTKTIYINPRTTCLLIGTNFSQETGKQ